MAKITDPLNVGRLTLRNRLVVPPIMTSYADYEGYPTQAAYNHYRELGRGGWGLVQVEGTAVQYPEGAVARCQFRIDDDKYVAPLAKLAQFIHEGGTPCTLQIMHGGPTSQWWIWRIGASAVGPSSDYAPLGGIFGRLRELTTTECEELIDLWVKAAIRAKKAGFDGITIHGATGNIPQAFMSPQSNHRNDKYGDRLAFVLELVSRIREAVGPDYPIIYRISTDEFVGDKGITLEWTMKVLPTIEKAGSIDAWDVNPGFLGGPPPGPTPTLYYPQAVNLKYASELKKVTSKPVMHAGKILDPKLAVSLVEEGKIDAVGIARGSFADPHFARKVIEGRYEDVRKCTSCHVSCLSLGFSRLVPVSCDVNPTLGLSPEEAEIKPATRKKTVVVCGGGVAGMEAARVAAVRGHEVILIHDKNVLGGQARLSSMYPGLNTRDLNSIVEWEETQLKKTKVKVELNRHADAAYVLGLNPDVVIIATGSRVMIPNVPGINRESVITLDQYLESGKVKGKKIVVFGGGYGAECAVSLATEGKEVVVLEEGPDSNVAVTPYIPMYSARWSYLMSEIGRLGIQVFTRVKLLEVGRETLKFVDGSGKQKEVQLDTLILAGSRVSNLELVSQLRAGVSELYIIGDAKRPGIIRNAVHEGFFTAKRI